MWLLWHGRYVKWLCDVISVTLPHVRFYCFMFLFISLSSLPNMLLTTISYVALGGDIPTPALLTPYFLYVWTCLCTY